MIEVDKGTMKAEGSDIVLLAELTIIITGLIQNDVLDEEVYKEIWKVANKSKDELQENIEKMVKINQLMELDKKNKKLEEKIKDEDFDEEELKKDMIGMLEELKKLL